jgi:hypothetical protein
MTHFTPGSFLLAFAAVVIGGGAVGSLLRRVSGRDRKRGDATAIFVERTRTRLQGTAAMLVGLAAALVAFPTASMLGLPTHLPGFTTPQSFFAVVLGVGLLVVIVSKGAGRRDDA